MKISYRKICCMVGIIMLFSNVLFASLFSIMIPNAYIRIAIIWIGMILLVPECIFIFDKSKLSVLLFFVLILFHLTFFNREIVYYVLLITPFFILILLKSRNMWFREVMIFLGISEIFFALATIILYFLPDIYYNYISPLYPSSSFELNLRYSQGCMPGLMNHYSTNGIVLSTGTILFFSKNLAYGRKKKLDVIMLIIVFIALLMSGKRGPLLFTISSLFILYIISKGKQKNKWVNVTFAIVIVAVASYIVISFVPALSSAFNRFTDSDDLTTGRNHLWTYAWEILKKHPLTGIGWRKYYGLAELKFGRGLDCHNIYLQLLCETGLIGFLIFMIMSISSLIKSVRTYKNSVCNNLLPKEDLFLLSFSIGFQLFFLLYGFTGCPLYEFMSLVPYFLSIIIANYYYAKCKC